MTYYDKDGKFTVEEVKLITNEEGYPEARKDAIEKLARHLQIWNALPDDSRKSKTYNENEVLPKVYEGNIVIFLLFPHTGEFRRMAKSYRFSKEGET